MTDLEPTQMRAIPMPGMVAILADSGTASALADAWEFAHACGGLDDTVRPTWLYDVAALKSAADAARRMAGADTAPVQLVSTARLPHLQVVAGGDL